MTITTVLAMHVMQTLIAIALLMNWIIAHRLQTRISQISTQTDKEMPVIQTVTVMAPTMIKTPSQIMKKNNRIPMAIRSVITPTTALKRLMKTS